MKNVNEKLILAIIVVVAITLGGGYVLSGIWPRYGYWIACGVAAIGTILALRQQKVIK